MNPTEHLPEGSFEREERCRRTIRTLVKAMGIRLGVAGILAYSLFTAPWNPFLLGLMVLILVMVLGPLLPLTQELRNRRGELKKIRGRTRT